MSMDIKTLSDEDLDSLLNMIKAEIENRHVSAEAPALIQQAAIKALALGASPANLQQALNKVLEVPVESSPPGEEIPDPPVEDAPEPTEEVPESPVEETPDENEEPPVEDAPEEPVVAPDPEATGGTS